MKEPSAKRAVEIVKSVYGQHGGGAVAWLVEPSSVLTLAGVRGVGEAVIYYLSTQQLQAYKQIVKQIQPILLEHSIFIDGKAMRTPWKANIYAVDMYSPSGLAYALAQSKIDLLPYTGTENRQQRSRWVDANIKRIAKALKLSRANAGHVVMGVLLGYPDKAILGMLPLWDDFEEMVKQSYWARIRMAGQYSGPQPVYDYPKALRQDPQIIRHEKLWSQILTNFYRSSLHRQIAKDADFIKVRRQMAKADKAAMADL